MPRPIFCYVTDGRAFEDRARANRDAPISETILDRIRLAAAAGVDWIQIREKHLDGGPLLLLAHAALASVANPGKAAETRTQILINDRLDVAEAAGAGGVHLRETSAPVERVVREVSDWKRETGGHEFLVGQSCHSLEGARHAERSGANYIFFGPVFATPSKAAFGAPLGIAPLAEVCRSVRIPVLAIGGITLTNAQECLESGARGIAAIRLFQESADIAGLLARLRG